MQVRSWKDMEVERLNDRITRQMIWGELIMVTRVHLDPEAEVPEHEHVSEQLTTVESGSITMTFPDGEQFLMNPGDMLVIPGSRPHSAKAGPEGCVAVDIFSPIRKDFIEGTASYYHDSNEPGDSSAEASADGADDHEKYRRLQGFLAGVGVELDLDVLKQNPLELVARYAYEKQSLTMGELRKVLGLEKDQAKALLREWKHGDDHSESSYKRSLERLVIVPPTWSRTTKG